MRALVFLCINQHTKFEVRSFTDSKDDYGEILKTGHVTLTMPLYKGGLSSLSWDMIVHYITLHYKSYLMYAGYKKLSTGVSQSSIYSLESLRHKHLTHEI